MVYPLGSLESHIHEDALHSPLGGRAELRKPSISLTHPTLPTKQTYLLTFSWILLAKNTEMQLFQAAKIFMRIFRSHKRAASWHQERIFKVVSHE